MVQVSIRRSIISNMLGVLLILCFVVLAVTFLGANELAKSLSRTLIGQSLDRTQAEIEHYIRPVNTALDVAQSWISGQEISVATPNQTVQLLIPLIEPSPQINSIILVNPQAQTLVLTRLPSGWRVRIHNPQEHPGVAKIRIPAADTSAPWRNLSMEFDPTSRPWFQRSAQLDVGQTTWSNAYRFFETNAPGVTAARVVVGPAGQRWTIAVDMLLEDLSAFTQSFDVGYDGMVLITDVEGKILGLPDLPQFATPSARERAYLKRPDQLGLRLAIDAAHSFRPDPSGSVVLEPINFDSDGNSWWGQAVWLPLGEDNEWFAGILISESQLLGSLLQLRIVILSATILITLLAIYRAISLARRYSQPIHSLADQSMRISSGNLDKGAPIASQIKEVNALANAHERMREGLAQLLKLEDDLKIASQIQQKTFPSKFPAHPKYDVAAGSRPAEATGGDTYDVVGLSRIDDGTWSMVDSNPDRIWLLLADATGHGVGPALTASQVRAMFRMGARAGLSLGALLGQINDQLCADSIGGRFVTAWVGCIDTKTNVLEHISAGQAPLMHLNGSDKTVVQLDAQFPPLGITSDIQFSSNHLTLRPKDIFAVISDGVFEARNAEGGAFGTERVEAMIADSDPDDAREVLVRLDQALTAHMANRLADDDQTALFVLHR